MKITDKQIKEILRLTAYIDEHGSTWGYDTEIYTSFESYAEDVRNILK